MSQATFVSYGVNGVCLRCPQVASRRLKLGWLTRWVTVVAVLLSFANG